MVSVTGLVDATAIAAGYFHTCALELGGSVVCWGRNPDGQLGNGSIMQATTPISVTGLSNALAIASGRSHTCALQQSGSVACWGDTLTDS